MFQTIPFSFLKSLGINKLECISCMCSFNRGSIEWSNSLKNCIWCMCIINYACFMFAWGLVLWTGLRKGLLFDWMRKVLKLCKFAYDRVGYPDVTLCSWRNVKIHLLTNSSLRQIPSCFALSVCCLVNIWFCPLPPSPPPPPPPPPFSTKSVLQFEWIWGPGRRGWLGTEIWVNL